MKLKLLMILALTSFVVVLAYARLSSEPMTPTPDDTEPEVTVETFPGWWGECMDPPWCDDYYNTVCIVVTITAGVSSVNNHSWGTEYQNVEADLGCSGSFQSFSSIEIYNPASSPTISGTARKVIITP